ncbi:uncharacterized protein LOC129594658 [Paramacrobiotus metropolitanus]|uniref:uncharacterized protein LOC129594658 n=1 Tax=Paramacrobiotus metropolitanus TaxID=2943436 RepID=UPI002445E2A1|nr:uncharacterized protein LOC129594658 [Paramacrobiotus metropolitanus]XP_055347397.1 uncharacterized protein LOC129594658 [Paramacrobiotus metropolitanus]
MSDRPFTITEFGDLQTDEELERMKASSVTQMDEALDAPLSSDPLTHLQQEPFAHIMPSQKYEGDYEGERLGSDSEFINNEKPLNLERKTCLPGGEGNATPDNVFEPHMSAEYVAQHKVGYMRDFVEANNSDAKPSDAQEELSNVATPETKTEM